MTDETQTKQGAGMRSERRATRHHQMSVSRPLTSLWRRRLCPIHFWNIPLIIPSLDDSTLSPSTANTVSLTTSLVQKLSGAQLEGAGGGRVVWGGCRGGTGTLPPKHDWLSACCLPPQVQRCSLFLVLLHGGQFEALRSESGNHIISAADLSLFV